jgi:hypothetical protein
MILLDKFSSSWQKKKHFDVMFRPPQSPDACPGSLAPLLQLGVDDALLVMQ